MINLFNIVQPKITRKYKNIINDEIVDEFIESFTQYVGADYGCAVSSATTGITMVLESLKLDRVLQIPTVIPPIVANSIYQADRFFTLKDDISWIGHAYELTRNSERIVIDSAQQVNRNQYKTMCSSDKDIMIFSFYPSKSCSGVDGGIIVSNDKSFIDDMKILSNNGMTKGKNSWSKRLIKAGYKAYMSSIQADVALQSLKRLDQKQCMIDLVRQTYNNRFGYNNTSLHLYTVELNITNDEFMKQKPTDICFGVHYRPIHWNKPYMKQCNININTELTKSDHYGKHTLSLPYHEKLTSKDVDYICKTIEHKITID